MISSVLRLANALFIERLCAGRNLCTTCCQTQSVKKTTSRPHQRVKLSRRCPRALVQRRGATARARTAETLGGPQPIGFRLIRTSKARRGQRDGQASRLWGPVQFSFFAALEAGWTCRAAIRWSITERRNRQSPPLPSRKPGRAAR
jgi:hypothetical protein